MAKKNDKVSVTRIEGGAIWKFANGETAQLLVSDFPEAIQAMYTVHGLVQKHSDTYAGAKTADEAFGAFMKAVDACKAGAWGTRVAGEPREEPIELLSQALAIVKYGESLVSEKAPEIAAKLKGFDKAKRDAYRRNPDVMVALARIKASKAAPSTVTLDEI